MSKIDSLCTKKCSFLYMSTKNIDGETDKRYRLKEERESNP